MRNSRFRKRLIFAILSIVSLFVPRAVPAQSIGDRLEVGVNLSVLRLSDFDATNAGLGGRLSFDLTRWAALEGEVNFFPRDRIRHPEGNTGVGPIQLTEERTRTDALFGVRIGARGSRVGAFVKARPGVTRLTDKGLRCTGPGCALFLPPAPSRLPAEFAFDFGGGVEVYPTARTVARVELGDTMIRHRRSMPSCPFSRCSTHNISSRIGLGYRF
jgi:hypothetical protein